MTKAHFLKENLKKKSGLSSKLCEIKTKQIFCSLQTLFRSPFFIISTPRRKKADEKTQKKG
jgi:hypothetical protein